MGYTDKEMMCFTQIAYADLGKGYDALCAKKPGKTSFSIDEVKVAAEKAGVPKEKLESLKCLSSKQMKDWQISGVQDSNSKNGFYACIIETVPGQAAVGFRGSESLKEFDNIKNDWFLADLGLLNSVRTNQQAATDAFLKKYSNQLNKYNSLAMTGHSLGGNLAEYATIMSDKYGLDDNITQCMSMDGPGFSDEFISLHLDKIKKMAHVMKHPRWSAVGTLLNDLPGVDYEFVSVSNEANTRDDDEYNSFTRHDTKYLEYDENDKLKHGEQDELSKKTSKISKAVENSHSSSMMLLFTAGVFWQINSKWIKDNLINENGLTILGQSVVYSAAALISIFEGRAISFLAITAFSAIIAVSILSIVYNITKEIIEKVVDSISKAIGSLKNWATEKISDLFNSTMDVLAKVNYWWDKNFNAGFKFSNENPYIEINTDRMKTYANQLAALSNRAKRLDSRMNSLYWKLDIDWNLISNLGRLLRADVVLDFAYRLDNCVGYLNDTADSFERTENSINSDC